VWARFPQTKQFIDELAANPDANWRDHIAEINIIWRDENGPGPLHEDKIKVPEPITRSVADCRIASRTFDMEKFLRNMMRMKFPSLAMTTILLQRTMRKTSPRPEL